VIIYLKELYWMSLEVIKKSTILTVSLGSPTIILRQLDVMEIVLMFVIPI
jgi:hypothetical protein